MVNYPDLSSLNETSGIGGLLALTTTAYPYYWAWMMAGLFIIITTSLYFTEKLGAGKGNLLSSMSVSAFAIIILSTIGTVVGFMPVDIMIYILVVSFLIWGVWIGTSKR